MSCKQLSKHVSCINRVGNNSISLQTWETNVNCVCLHYMQIQNVTFPLPSLCFPHFVSVYTHFLLNWAKFNANIVTQCTLLVFNNFLSMKQVLMMLISTHLQFKGEMMLKVNFNTNMRYVLGYLNNIYWNMKLFTPVTLKKSVCLHYAKSKQTHININNIKIESTFRDKFWTIS